MFSYAKKNVMAEHYDVTVQLSFDLLHRKIFYPVCMHTNDWVVFNICLGLSNSNVKIRPQGVSDILWLQELKDY